MGVGFLYTLVVRRPFSWNCGVKEGEFHSLFPWWRGWRAASCSNAVRSYRHFRNDGEAAAHVAFPDPRLVGRISYCLFFKTLKTETGSPGQRFLVNRSIILEVCHSGGQQSKHMLASCDPQGWVVLSVVPLVHRQNQANPKKKTGLSFQTIISDILVCPYWERIIERTEMGMKLFKLDNLTQC